MKTKLLLFACLPVVTLAAQNRMGPPASSPGERANAIGPRYADCLRYADCPLASLDSSNPTTLPTQDLVSAVEEERMAHDLYTAAAQRWNLRVFSNIAAAETRHAAVLERLAIISAVALPTAQAGVYATAELQRMYDQLMALINESETGALRAGALVEETDIIDLRHAMTLATDTATQEILASLERASTQHLVAFVRNLESRGVTYQPQLLTADEFATAMATPGGPGPGRSRGYRGGR